MLKTFFFGTPALAVPYLEVVSEQTHLLGVVTTPDEPSGRGYALKPTPVKEAASKFSCPLWQPEKLKDEAFQNSLKGFSIDIGIVVAYGKLLPKSLLEIPRLG